MATTVHFLLVHSIDAGRLVHQDELTDRDKAISAYEDAGAGVACPRTTQTHRRA